MSSYFKRNKITWGLIFLQFFYILLPHSAYSSQSIKKSYPLTPFEKLGPDNYPLEMPEIVVIEKKTKKELALPDLGNSDYQLKEEDKFDKKLALGLTQFGSILSENNHLESSINYAKNIGQGLVNQRVNDWLNQYSKARVSFGIDQKFSGEILLPLIDKPNSLFFTQWGLRTNKERNIINLGLGYRQYWRDWMYGINTFYDYDYTGGNARLGIGGEAWTDYLKLSANGYFGLTDWHQSKISAMDDYYERPASGFDIRAQAYLPNYPKLGGSIKYEKYFGKGVHIGNGADKNNLENNPYALTLGINYTPIPLLTFKGEHTAGDRNDTSIGLDIIYNFGVPLLQQVDPNSVDVIHNLAGNKYDFVDRNYDIVMQYYKQKLIGISLPKEILGEGNELVIIPVTVHENKYGLKQVNWIFPANFFDNGGTYNQISPIQIEVKLPAYMFNLKDNTPEEYSVSAVAEDNNGNVSETTKTLIRVKRSKNIINSLNITPNKIIPADNIDYFTITAFVTNEHNQPLIAQNITFTVEGLKKSNDKSGIILFDEYSSNQDALQVKTDGQGKAVVKVRSTVSGKGKIIAKMENGNHSNQPIEFSADAKSAKILTFTVKKDNALANNKEKNELYLLVTDKHENLVKNLIVNLTGNNESKIENITTNNIKTNENGELIIYVTNAKSGISEISAAINGHVKTQSITFLSDISTARVDRVTLTDFNDVKIADGESFFTFNALVTDEQGNLAPEVEVNWQQNKGDLVVLPTSSTTNREGIATIQLQSSKNFISDVQVSAKVLGKQPILADKTVTFRGPAATSSLQLDNPSIAANDSDEVKLTFIAKDLKNNNIESIAPYLSFKISDSSGKILSSNSDGITLSPVEEDLNEKGKYNATIKGTKVGKYNVIPYFHDNPILESNQHIELKADVNSAEVKSVNLEGSATELLANGENSFTFKAIVKDRLGHPVSDVEVNWQQDKNDLVVLPISSTTNKEGIATIKLQSSENPVSHVQVMAHLNGKSTPADKTVSFIGPVADKSSLHIDKPIILANNEEETTLTFAANDENGTPIENITNHLSFEIKDSSGNVVDTNKMSLTEVKEDPQEKGKYSVRIKGPLAGKYTIIPKFNDIPIDILKKTVELIADKSTAEVKSLTLDGSDTPKIANNINSFRFKAIVKDKNGNPVNGVAVTGTHDKKDNILTLQGGQTNSQGEAIITLKSNTVAVSDIEVSAGVKNQSPKEKADKKVSFIANYRTARVENVSLMGNNTPKIANDNDKFTFIAEVKDGYGNPVPNVNISWSHDKKAHFPLLNSEPSKTNERGEARFDLTSHKAVIDIQVSAKLDEGAEKTAHEKVSFIADSSTAIIASLTTDKSYAIADGKEVITFTVKVTDKNNNPVNNNKVTVSKTGNATLAGLTNNNVITNSDGQATFTLTSTTPDSNVVSVINDTDTIGKTITRAFIADKNTARIVKVNALESTKTVGLYVSIEIMVQDANSNPVNDATVTLSSNPDARVTFYKENTGTDRLTNNQATTDDNGKLMVYVTSLTAQKIKVAANLVNNPQDENNTTDIDFIPDITTARIRDTNFTVVIDNQVANGIAKNKVKVKVVDDKENPVPHIPVRFEADKATTPNNLDVNTDALGEAEFELAHTTAESVNIKATSINNIFKQKDVTFIADYQTAEVKNVSLEGTNIPKIADSISYFVFKAIVEDKSGNLVKNQEVSWRQDKGNLVTLSSNSGITNEKGEATIKLTSTSTPVDDVQISAYVLQKAPKHAADKVSFVGPDENKSMFEINPPQIVANGMEKATLTFIANNTKGLPLPVENIINQLSFEIKNESGNTPEHGNISLTNLEIDTQERSKYNAEIKGNLAGKYTIIPKFNHIPIDTLKKTVELIADESTAEVKSLTLDGSDTTKIANNTNSFRFKAIVKDKNGNPVEGVVVTGTHDKKDNILTLQGGQTNSQGEAILILKSNNVAVQDVQVSAGVRNQIPLVYADKVVTFFNEEVTFTGTVSNAIIHDGPIPNATIKFYKADDPTKLEYSVTTDSSGRYKIDKFKKGSIYIIKAEANGFITIKYDNMDIKYDYLDFRLSPHLSADTEKRILLKWKSNKNAVMDLDSSLCRRSKSTGENKCVRSTKSTTRSHEESGIVKFLVDKDERPNLDSDQFQTHNETITLKKLEKGYDYFYTVKSQMIQDDDKNMISNNISEVNNPEVTIQENILGTLGLYKVNDTIKGHKCWVVFKIDGNSELIESIDRYENDCPMF